MSFHIFHCKTRTFIICYCCFWTRKKMKKKLNFMCILRINNCGKKQMWNKSCIVIEIPKIWKISPQRQPYSHLKKWVKRSLWPGSKHSTTVNYLSLQYQSLSCFRCFEVHLLEDNPVLDEERRWCSTSIIMSLWLMTEKRTFCYCKRACGYCKNPWKKWAQKREVLNCYHSISNYTSFMKIKTTFFQRKNPRMNFCWTIRRKRAEVFFNPFLGANNALKKYVSPLPLFFEVHSSVIEPLCI